MQALETPAAPSATPPAAAPRWLLPMPGRTRRPDIGVILDGTGMESIGRLRYDLFVDRDGKAYACADPSTRTFLEPIDEVSLNFHYTPVDETLASVRLSWAMDALSDPHLAPIVMNSGVHRRFWAAASVASRLAIRDTAAAKRQMLPMFQELYQAAVLTGLRYNLISCRPSLVDLFHRIGFVSSEMPVLDPVAGTLEVMVLDLRNEERLSRWIISQAPEATHPKSPNKELSA